MPSETFMDYMAALSIEVADFGPECDIYIDGEPVAYLKEHTANGICDRIDVDVCFRSPIDSKCTELTVQVFREWKGEKRLVFTRKIRVTDGKNDLLLSYNGISSVSLLTSIFRRRAPYAEHA